MTCLDAMLEKPERISRERVKLMALPPKCVLRVCVSATYFYHFLVFIVTVARNSKRNMLMRFMTCHLVIDS